VPPVAIPVYANGWSPPVVTFFVTNHVLLVPFSAPFYAPLDRRTPLRPFPDTLVGMHVFTLRSSWQANKKVIALSCLSPMTCPAGFFVAKMFSDRTTGLCFLDPPLLLQTCRAIFVISPLSLCLWFCVCLSFPLRVAHLPVFRASLPVWEFPYLLTHQPAG